LNSDGFAIPLAMAMEKYLYLCPHHSLFTKVALKSSEGHHASFSVFEVVLGDN
jgi:hypothetical protein